MMPGELVDCTGHLQLIRQILWSLSKVCRLDDLASLLRAGCRNADDMDKIRRSVKTMVALPDKLTTTASPALPSAMSFMDAYPYFTEGTKGPRRRYWRV